MSSFANSGPITAPMEFRLLRPDLRPEDIRVTDLNLMTKSVNDAVTATVFADIDQENARRVLKAVDASALFVGLANIDRARRGYQFIPTFPDVTVPAWERVVQAVEGDTYSRLPPQANIALRGMIRFAKKYGSDAQLIANTTRGELTGTATLEQSVEIVQAPQLVGETTLYGYLFRVGGRKRTTALIAPISGGLVTAKVPRSLAGALGARLYHHVGVEGLARWNARTLNIEAFEVRAITPYRDTPIDEAFQNIRERFGHHFDTVNVEEFMADIRGQ